ncbi:MAG: hypothetical protein KGZ58_01570 [Ignavibacteriales bacterium]|nr:hypothetical protein [Ignavibacteriales bacterium]
MLTITPMKITQQQVILDKHDFEELIVRAKQIEQVVVKENDEMYSMNDVEYTLREIWNNDEDEKVWQQYL